MDKTTRNAIQNATQAARQRLEQAYRDQLEGTFDILPDGTIAAAPGSHLDERQCITREKLVAAIAHKRAVGLKPREAVADFLREAAFTTFNRFVALKLLEARKQVQDCVSRGEDSSGFKEFTALAPGLAAIPDKGYRLYLDSLFDELSRDLKVLFDRHEASSLLWPDRQTLIELLGILNAPALAEVWGEDETIGWVYQYWNSKEERKAMREASAAPRNSRELAVRNQFFTPRYVVEFLVDNTLGRIWYEMTKGETRLVEQCRYLVRRPAEVFLAEGEEVASGEWLVASEDGRGSDGVTSEALTQEELLRQPVHIPHRPLKDPREILFLDPSCGSMHFGLYAFDLFEIIYEEAWDKGLCPALQAEYPSKAEFLRDIPRLIIEHNIHGVDIDPRAVQIAALSLWLRALKSWRELPPVERPRLRRTQIVCAEPMPGDRAMLEDFVRTLDPPLLGELVKTVFEKMQLAGEAGTLLKIEEEIRTAIEAARQEAERQRGDLFTQAEAMTEGFFEDAEERIYNALQAYAESAEAGDYQRRLFAEDAARGFAFIDLCRKRYDAVVMNPPFGSFSKMWAAESKRAYPNSANDILGAFVDCCLCRLRQQGRLGAITSRTGFFLTTFTDWRRKVVLKKSAVRVIADLGQGVMDDAMVEAAAYVLEKTHPSASMTVFRAIADADRQKALEDCLHAHNSGESEPRVFSAFQHTFDLLPDSPFVYWIDEKSVRIFDTRSTFEPGCGHVRVGLQTGNDFRFVRAIWEPSFIEQMVSCLSSNKDSNEDAESLVTYYKSSSERWAFHVKAGSSQPWYSPLTLKVNFANSGSEMRAALNANGKPRAVIRSPEFFYRPGFSWTRRAVRFYPYVVPFGAIASTGRYMAFPNHGMQAEALGVCASRLVSAFLRFYGEKFEFPNFLVDTLKALPWPQLPDSAKAHFEQLIAREVEQRRLAYQNHEPFHEFLLPCKIRDFSNGGQSLAFDPESLLDAATEKMVADAYGFSDEQARAVERDLLEAISYQRTGGISTEEDEAGMEDGEADAEEADPDFVLDYSPPALEEAHLSYLIGTTLGRWDIRYAIGQRQPPELPDPFDPLPVCPPGMLQNADGLPAAPADVPDDYPLRITWSGILVDDPGHPDDIVSRVREALAVIWGERAAAIDQEACEILGLKQLRDYFAEKKSGSAFFKAHLSRYSKSRRQAPIYWPLSTDSGRYSFWIYYHRFDANTLYSLLRLVQDKLGFEERKLAELTQDAGLDPTAKQRKALDEQAGFVAELRGFSSELNRVAPLWKPNLNDGVIINSAPVWRLLRYSPWQKKVKDCWDKLVKGDYDWAHLAMHLWPERVVPKCQSDRSLAIAHGLEDAFWQQDDNDKWQPHPISREQIDALIVERSSSAVKAALQDLLDAPTAGGSTRRKTRSKA